MNYRIVLPITALGAALTLVLAPLALADPIEPVPPATGTAAPTTTPAPSPSTEPDVPPALAQLCLATGIDEVDDLLADLSRSDLVDELSPLLTLLVPESESVELDASVQLEDVRQRLNCAPATPDPDTTDPTPTPSAEPSTPATDDDDLIRLPDRRGFSQVDDVPLGAADTGGGPLA